MTTATTTSKMPYTKPAAIIEATELVTAFVDMNGLEHPAKIQFNEKRSAPNFGWYLYHQRRIVVFSQKCRMPSYSPFSWTWPRYKADLTIIGVTAHEMGHHVDEINEIFRPRRTGQAMKKFAKGEPPLTAYAASAAAEDFAETMKVFITNPTLLEIMAPRRYEFIREALALIPIETRPWDVLLAHSQRHLDRVSKLLER